MLAAPHSHLEPNLNQTVADTAQCTRCLLLALPSLVPGVPLFQCVRTAALPRVLTTFPASPDPGQVADRWKSALSAERAAAFPLPAPNLPESIPFPSPPPPSRPRRAQSRWWLNWLHHLSLVHRLCRPDRKLLPNNTWPQTKRSRQIARQAVFFCHGLFLHVDYLPRNLRRQNTDGINDCLPASAAKLSATHLALQRAPTQHPPTAPPQTSTEGLSYSAVPRTPISRAVHLHSYEQKQ